MLTRALDGRSLRSASFKTRCYSLGPTPCGKEFDDDCLHLAVLTVDDRDGQLMLPLRSRYPDDCGAITRGEGLWALVRAVGRPGWPARPETPAAWYNERVVFPFSELVPSHHVSTTPPGLQGPCKPFGGVSGPRFALLPVSCSPSRLAAVY